MMTTRQCTMDITSAGQVHHGEARLVDLHVAVHWPARPIARQKLLNLLVSPAVQRDSVVDDQ